MQSNGSHRRWRRLGRRPASYANVAATLALVLALGGGTAWAAQHYLITSTHQIKPSVLRYLHGARGPRGYRGYQGSQGKVGTPGTPGSPGAIGATGPTGAAGATNVTEQIASGTIPASNSGVGTATCPTGTKATGGGGFDGGDSTAVIYEDGPLPNSGTAATPTGWQVSWKTGANAITWHVYAICAAP